MSSQPLIGEIMPWAGNFAPRGWAFCDGQILAIAQNQALFSILGTMYGGDGRTTFALPDLRGRAPIGAGHGPGLSAYTQGEKKGVEEVTLTQEEIPAHTHTATPGTDMAAAISANRTNATSSEPLAGGVLATAAAATRGDPVPAIYNSETPDVALAPAPVTGSVSVADTGGSRPHENRMPYQAIQYCIALEGIFPSRN